jgi:alpha-amylase
VECPSVITSVAKVTQEGNQIEIFPNPVKNFINIISEKQIKKVSVASINGTITDIIESTGETSQFDVSQLNSGIYFLIVRDAAGNDTIGRFIKK